METSMSKQQEIDASTIDEVIDDLPLHEMTEEEMENAIDPNSMAARLERRQVRYWLYCLRSNAEKEKPLPDSLPAGFRSRYVDQLGFDGWENFAVNWDVALHDPSTIVSREHSEAEVWDLVVQAKFPQLTPDGSVKYPDLSVQRAVEEELEKQQAQDG